MQSDTWVDIDTYLFLPLLLLEARAERVREDPENLNAAPADHATSQDALSRKIYHTVASNDASLPKAVGLNSLRLARCSFIPALEREED